MGIVVGGIALQVRTQDWGRRSDIQVSESDVCLPPAALLRALVSRIIALGLRVVLVVPEWPQADWWPLVCTRPRIQCGRVKECVEEGEAQIPHPFGPSFHLEHALNTELQARAFNL